MRGARGAAVIKAVALGNELTCRLGVFLSPTGTGPGADWFLSQLFGYFGGSFATGLMLGLTEDELVAALGIAYMQLAGGKEPAFATGANTRAIYTGFAAHGALQAALLARAGMIGPASTFEGKAGVFPLYLGMSLSDADIASLVEPGLWRWEATNIKPYPCCRSSHPFVSVALELHKRIGGRSIEAIEVAVNARAGFLCKPIAERRRPSTLADAKYSIPYMVAFALIHGQVDLNTLVEEALEDASVKDLADRLTVSETLPDGPGLAPAEISITLANGCREHARFAGALEVNPAEVEAKFISCLNYARRSEAAGRWGTLQPMENMTIEEIIGTLAPQPKTRVLAEHQA